MQTCAPPWHWPTNMYREVVSASEQMETRPRYSGWLFWMFRQENLARTQTVLEFEITETFSEFINGHITFSLAHCLPGILLLNLEEKASKYCPNHEYNVHQISKGRVMQMYDSPVCLKEHSSFSFRWILCPQHFNISHTFIHLFITGPKLLLDFLSFFTHRCCIHTCGEQAHA
jgi:hypothetical protein